VVSSVMTTGTRVPVFISYILTMLPFRDEIVLLTLVFWPSAI
jgi:hypothetical protein